MSGVVRERQGQLREAAGRVQGAAVQATPQKMRPTQHPPLAGVFQELWAQEARPRCQGRPRAETNPHGGQEGRAGSQERVSVRPGSLDGRGGARVTLLDHTVTIPWTTKSALSSIAALNSVFRMIYLCPGRGRPAPRGGPGHGVSQLSLDLASTPLGQCP